MVFFGEYEVSFSSPGRIVLPKKMREMIKGAVFVLSKSYDGCLGGYDKEDWEHRSKELMTVSLITRENLDKRRFLFASTITVEIDDHGRFVIPKNMLEYAQIVGKAVIIGVGDHFEIWSTERWQKYIKNMNSLTS